MTVVYDAGALVAAERSDRWLWADHRARLEHPWVTSDDHDLSRVAATLPESVALVHV